MKQTVRQNAVTWSAWVVPSPNTKNGENGWLRASSGTSSLGFLALPADVPCDFWKRSEVLPEAENQTDSVLVFISWYYQHFLQLFRKH